MKTRVCWLALAAILAAPASAQVAAYPARPSRTVLSYAGSSEAMLATEERDLQALARAIKAAKIEPK